MSANIPPAKDPGQELLRLATSLYDDLSERIRVLEVSLATTTAVLILAFVRENPETARDLVRKVMDERDRQLAQERSEGASEVATTRELLELLLRKDDPLKPDA